MEKAEHAAEISSKTLEETHVRLQAETSKVEHLIEFSAQLYLFCFSSNS